MKDKELISLGFEFVCRVGNCDYYQRYFKVIQLITQQNIFFNVQNEAEINYTLTVGIENDKFYVDLTDMNRHFSAGPIKLDELIEKVNKFAARIL